jgi:hypothetical protein
MALLSIGLLPVLVVMLAQDISGPAASGWASFGIAGLVLAWLLLVYLPSKDKERERSVQSKDEQVKALMDRYDSERERERDDRHKRLTEFQVVLNKVSADGLVMVKEMVEQHRKDADNDRAAFEGRQQRTESVIFKAIELQTAEIKAVFQQFMSSICRYNPEQHRGKPT